jgi:hypothetical protein
MIKRFTPDTYLQVGRAEEMYAATFRCMTCKATWSGRVEHDPKFPGQWPGEFKFCPCCGVAFKGELERRSEQREQWRCDAGWKAHHWTEAQKITYIIQRRVEWPGRGSWETDSSYFPSGTRQQILIAWRNRLSEGSMFGEEVRLIARTPSGKEKVVFGSVVLGPNTHVNNLFVWHGGKRKLRGSVFN